jgi:hypothetical protein
MVRGRIRDLIKNSVMSYYTYIVNDTDRPDTLAFNIYGASHYAWLIFYANDMFDPLYDWVLSDRDFEKFIVSKYGNIGNARSEADEALILTLGSGSGTFFIGQQVFQGASFTNSVSSGIVTEWNPIRKTLRLRNVKGDFHRLSGVVNATGSSVSYNIKLRTNLIHHYEIEDGQHEGLIIDQATFLDPFSFVGQSKKAVTHYEYELRLNESKRNVKIINQSYLSQITNEMKVLFLD